MEQALDAALAEQRRLAKDIAAVRAQLRTMGGQSRRTDHGIQSLLRRAALPDDLPYPQRLLSRRFSLRSQNAEDGLTLALLDEIGVATRRFVDIGCGSNGGNSGFLAEELGWSGLMLDGDTAKLAILRGATSRERVKVADEWITAENIDELIAAHGFSGEIDVLSIDLDGIDYWLWQRLTACTPRLVIVEYNSGFGADRAVVVPYDPAFRRHDVQGLHNRYYGASLRALTILGAQKGFRLVAVEPRGTNAFFVRNDLAPSIPACDPVAEYRLLNKYRRDVQTGFDLWARIEQEGLPLIDLDNDA